MTFFSVSDFIYQLVKRMATMEQNPVRILFSRPSSLRQRLKSRKKLVHVGHSALLSYGLTTQLIIAMLAQPHAHDVNRRWRFSTLSARSVRFVNFFFMLFYCSVTTRNCRRVPLWLQKLFSGNYYSINLMHRKLPTLFGVISSLLQKGFRPGGEIPRRVMLSQHFQPCEVPAKYQLICGL